MPLKKKAKTTTTQPPTKKAKKTQAEAAVEERIHGSVELVDETIPWSLRSWSGGRTYTC